MCVQNQSGAKALEALLMGKKVQYKDHPKYYLKNGHLYQECFDFAIQFVNSDCLFHDEWTIFNE